MSRIVFTIKKYSAIINQYLIISIVLIFLIGCSRLEISSQLQILNQNNLLDHEREVLATSCEVSQISSSQISNGNIEFVLTTKIKIKNIEYSCNATDWSIINSSFKDDRNQIIKNLSEGVYNCKVRLKSTDDKYVFCQGTISSSVTIESVSSPILSDGESGTTTEGVSTVSSDSNYTYDEFLPDLYSAFIPLRDGQWVISNYHVHERTGMVGLRFPQNWVNLQPGQSVRLRVLIPPGANLVNWRVEAPNFVALFGACDSFGRNCRVDYSYTPTIFPFGYDGQSPVATPVDLLPEQQNPSIGYFIVKAMKEIDFQFLSLTVNYNIKNKELYENWRSARSWAGGSEDCDALSRLTCR